MISEDIRKAKNVTTRSLAISPTISKPSYVTIVIVMKTISLWSSMIDYSRLLGLKERTAHGSSYYYHHRGGGAKQEEDSHHQRNLINNN
jgi:hypothetical protein